MENIELIDVVTAAADFLDEPENEEKFKKFEEIKQKTVVKAFLPLRVKSTIGDKYWKDSPVVAWTEVLEAKMDEYTESLPKV